MGISTSPSTRLYFGPFELDPYTGELWKSGHPVKLPPQPAKLLTFLASRQGKLVTRQEIKENLWGADTFVDFEQGLNFCIKTIRAALGDSADQPEYIQTLPRRGYRFIGSARTESPAVPPQTVPHRRKAVLTLGLTFLAAAGVIVALLFAFDWGHLRERWLGGADAHRIESLAVLPLRNLSRDPEQEYFSDGMTDELITDLAKSDGLRVISHTSVERYKGTKRSLPEIAHELGVDAVVEGTVMHSGERVRITAQLIDGRSDQHLWANSYERDVNDVLTLQNDVARDIASEVAIKLSSRPQEHLWTTRRIAPQAHEAYLKGLYNASRLTPEGLQKGIEYFDQSIQLDAGYAPAYAGKAEAYSWAAGLSILPPGDVLPKARSTANRALELDETLSQAHHSLAWVKYALDWDFAGAEAHFRRAVELNANDVTAHLWYGMFLAQRGRINESLAEMKRAQELDPLSLMVQALAATPLVESRQYDAATAQVNKALLMDPSNGVGHWMLITSYERKGELSKAIDEMEKQAILWGQSPENAAKQMAPLREAYSIRGAKGYWQSRLDSLGPDSAQGHADQYRRAVALARLGENNRAIACLDRSYAARSTELLYWLQGETAFDPMRTDPRFQELLRHVGVQSVPHT